MGLDGSGEGSEAWRQNPGLWREDGVLSDLRLLVSRMIVG